MARRKPAATDPDVGNVAALIGDPARAPMLLALLGDAELTAGELAYRAGVSPSSASAHLAKLVAGGLLRGSASGRQRLFRLASPEVGEALEALAAIARPARIVALSQDAGLRRLREARTCYDHLAGRLGVAVTDRFVASGALALDGAAFVLGRRGDRIFGELGVDLDAAREQRRTFARPCLDWTERRPHLAGSLGAALLRAFLGNGWVSRVARTRALRVTPEGARALERHFGIR